MAMVASLGNFTLWLSLFLSLSQFLISNEKINFKKHQINSLVVKGLLICSLVSFFSLLYCHVVSDFSVLNVYQNSHTSKPLIYKISGVWGNHEGSMLLWILVLTLFNYFIFKLYKKKN